MGTQSVGIIYRGMVLGIVGKYFPGQPATLETPAESAEWEIHQILTEGGDDLTDFLDGLFEEYRRPSGECLYLHALDEIENAARKAWEDGGYDGEG